MKRLLFSGVLLFLVASLIYSETGVRTIVNREGVPLLYVHIPVADLPSVIARERSAPTPEDALLLLQEWSEELELLAPGGMWRIPSDEGALVGYFSGGASAATSQLISLWLNQEQSPVTIAAPDSVISPDHTGRRLEAWELPRYSEPVVLDGLADEWVEQPVLARFGAVSPPPRVENSRSGLSIPFEEAVFFRRGGTGITRVRSVLGNRWWYLAIDSSEPVEDGTFFHFRIFPDRQTHSSAGQLVIAVDERSGPVVFRAPAGEIVLTGQYVRRGNFLELSIARSSIEELLPQAFQRSWSVDIASSRGDERRREHFTFGTIYLNEIPGE